MNLEELAVVGIGEELEGREWGRVSESDQNTLSECKKFSIGNKLEKLGEKNVNF